MDENGNDLKAALRALAEEESGGAGPHASLKRLIAYRRGALTAAEREVLQEHLSLCRRCAGLLLELRRFEESSAGGAAGAAPVPADAWDSLARRLPWKGSALRPIAGATRRETPRPRTERWLAGAAAALLLVLAGIAVWAGLTLRQERRQRAGLELRLHASEAALAAERARPAGEAARLYALEARVRELTAALNERHRNGPGPDSRSQSARAVQQIAVAVAPRFVLRGQEDSGGGLLRGGGAVEAVRIPDQADRFTVAFNLAGRPVYGVYRLELLDRNGKVLWTDRQPGKALLGDDGTSLTVSGLGPGHYRLQVEGLHPHGSDLLADDRFDVVTASPR